MIWSCATKLGSFPFRSKLGRVLSPASLVRQQIWPSPAGPTSSSRRQIGFPLGTTDGPIFSKRLQCAPETQMGVLGEAVVQASPAQHSPGSLVSPAYPTTHPTSRTGCYRNYSCSFLTPPRACVVAKLIRSRYN